jgi:hypothetical protein
MNPAREGAIIAGLILRAGFADRPLFQRKSKGPK